MLTGSTISEGSSMELSGFIEYGDGSSGAAVASTATSCFVI
jgi:hypothetical protein